MGATSAKTTVPSDNVKTEPADLATSPMTVWDPEVHSRLREPGGVLGDQTNKTTIARLSRVGWDTVARICERAVTDCLKPTSWKAIADIKLVEVNWRRHHNYLTLFQDHAGKKIL